MSSFRLALRVLRVDRRTRTSAILTGIGVAVATALVLLLIGLPFATEARGERSMWQAPSYSSGEDGSKDTATLSLASSEDYAGDAEITRVDVAALTDPSSIDLPEGIGKLPGPGETLLSPALARMTDGVPGSQLGDRFGESVGVLGEAALKYPDQLVALVGHEPGDMPVTAAEQHGFASGGAEQDPLLQLLAGVGVVVLLVPSLVLVASAARLTAARREQRLAALRLAGATPKQVVAMVAAETAIAALGGAALGLAASPALHSLAALVPWDRGTWQRGDFTLPLGVALPVTLAVPVLVLLAAVLGLRRVMWTPLGATGSHARKPLHWWRLLALPVSGLVFLYAVTSDDPGLMPVLGGLGLIVASAALVGPWVTSAVGGVFVRIWRRPSVLLAGRRLRDDPKGAYRASAGVVLAVFTGSMTLTLLPTFESMAGSSSPYRESALYVETTAEHAGQIVDETNASLERYGRRERAAEVGEIVLANGPTSGQTVMVADCASAAKLLRVDMNGACEGEPGIYSEYPLELRGVSATAAFGRQGEPMPADTPVRPIIPQDNEMYLTPIVDPAVLPAGVRPEAVTVAVPTTAANHEVVRTALAAAADGAEIQSRVTRLADQQSQLSDLRRVTVIGLVAAAVLSGCSAAIATAGSVMDRRRTFGALIAAGTPVRVLARALRTEAAMPAIVATVGAGAVGVLVGIGLFSLVDDGSVVLSPWILAPVVLGAGVAVLAASVCRPALNRVRSEPLADE